MANPTLSKKSDVVSLLTVDPRAQRMFQQIYREQNKEEIDDDTPKIKVSTLISRMSFYYEKIRNTVEYKEEHLFRKNAIERILKREILFQGAFQEVKSEEVARRLLVELIRAAYLPNNKIEESKVFEVSDVISKYFKFRRLSMGNLPDDSEIRREFARWVIAMAACEIEELFGLSETTRLMVDYMSEVMADNIAFPEKYREDKEIQIYLSIHRIFLKFDRDMLSFILLKYFNEGWKEATEDNLVLIAKNISELYSAINGQIGHPLAKQLDRITNRYTVFFTILKDVIDEDPVGVYGSIKKDPRAFPRAVKRVCEKRYQFTGSKLWGAAIRSILYILITKSILVVILEIPATKLFGETVNILSLAINVGFPPLLLFLLIMFTPLPTEENSKKIVEGIEQIIFVEKERKEQYTLRVPIKRKSGLFAFFNLLYAATFLASFGFVIWLLREINFSFVSIIIFVFFLTLISFFSIRIRKRVRELVVIEPKESLFSFLTDFFYTPILEVGKFLSEKFSRINVFMFILDFIIEAPFKIFVEVADEWSKYVKDRREEI